MERATKYYNHNRGDGWRRVQTGPNKGKYEYYKNHKATGQIKSNLTLGSGVAKAISSTVKKAQSSMKIRKDKRTQATIGSGTAKNPQYKRHQRSGKLIANPSYTPPTKKLAPQTKAVDASGSRRPFQNKVSGNGGSSESTETKVVKNNEKLKVKPKVDLRKKYTNIVNRQASGKNSVMFQKAKTWLRNNPVK